MLLDTNVCEVSLQNHAGYTGESCQRNTMSASYEIHWIAVMRAAVIDITTEEQRQIVRRLFREAGNVNVKTKDVRIEMAKRSRHALTLVERTNSVDVGCQTWQNGSS
jgi:hypothetical protein